MKKTYKIGYVQGTFDLFHIGHLNLLKKAKEKCSYLIVGVVSDELNEHYKGIKPYINFEERAAIVSAIKYTDKTVCVNFENEDKFEAWKLYKFDCHFSGDDHIGEWDYLIKKLRSVGSNVEFIPYTQKNSSTKIKNIFKNDFYYNKMSFFSFDIFDTIITRKTGTPGGIFLLAQKKLIKEKSSIIIPERIKKNFYDLRVYYEAMARLEKCNENIEDIDIEDIYNIFSKLENLTLEQKQYLMQIEIEIEKNNIVGIDSMIDQVKKIYNANKRIVLISDMYLKENIIRDILVKIDDVFKKIKIYVSSESGKTKFQKSLFKEIAQNEKIEFNEWVHYGDNKISDIKNAEFLGINTIHFKEAILLKSEEEIIKNHKYNLQLELLFGENRIKRLKGEETSNEIKVELYSEKNKKNNGVFSCIVGSKIVIYGAGKIGKTIYDKLISNNIEVVLWVDKNYKNITSEDYPISSIEDINSEKFDQVIIAIKDIAITKEVSNNLIKMGVNSNKIVWSQCLNI